MNDETERARELLQSVDKTLEQARARPHYESSWLEPDAERQVAVPVVRKVREEARREAPTMDAETQAKWDAWAKRVAKREAVTQCKNLSTAMIEALGPRLKELDDRLAELEREIAGIKQRQPAPAEEWPLRAIKGGRR